MKWIIRCRQLRDSPPPQEAASQPISGLTGLFLLTFSILTYFLPKSTSFPQITNRTAPSSGMTSTTSLIFFKESFSFIIYLSYKSKCWFFWLAFFCVDLTLWELIYRISSNNSRRRLFLFSHKKEAIIRGRRLFQILLTGSRALNILLYFLIKSKNNHFK